MTVDRDDRIEETYRHGQCYPMACALSERLGWPIEALVVDLPSGLHVVHAWVADPDGPAFDAGGPFDRAGLHEEFLANSHRRWSNQRLETFASPQAFLDRLRVAFGRDDLWPEYLDFFAKTAAEAAQAVEAYVVPRYLPALAAAAPAPR